MAALTASALCKSFGEVTALKDMDLIIERGSFFGLLGPNGAGKSTFMSIVSGFLPADSGSVSILGEELNPADMNQKQLIGLAPQNIALYQKLSAEENLKVFGELSGLKGVELKNRIDEALALAQLTDRRKSLVKEFSGGMMRRLNISVALMNEPEILLCDEPTVGVDPQSRNAIFDSLEELNQRGLTIIYSTHYMEEAERMCDTIGIIDRGHILRTGDIDSLMDELPSVDGVNVRRKSIPDSVIEDLANFGTVTEKERTLQLQPDGDFQLSAFFRWIEERNLDYRDFNVQRPSLENLFLQLTGRELRE